MGLFANLLFGFWAAYNTALVFMQVFVVDKFEAHIRIRRARVLQKKGQVRVNARYR